MPSAALSRAVGGPRAVREPMHARIFFARRTGRPRGRPRVLVMPRPLGVRGVAGRWVWAVRGTLWR